MIEMIRMTQRPFVETRLRRNAPPSHAAVLTAEEVRAAERAVAPDGPALLALMERAGGAAAQATATFCGPAETLVICGPGNNGGDGYFVAAALRARGWTVRVAAEGPPQAEPARTVAGRWDGPVEPLASAAPASILVDALFGIGLTRRLEGVHAAALARLVAAARVTIALDLPSGLDGDSGGDFGAAAADLTIAFGALKPAHLLEPGASRCGRIVLADIGLDTSGARTRSNGPPAFAPLAADTHKYRRGHVLVLSGPAGRGGAARLAARAAARAGAGVVTVGAPPDAVLEHATRLDSIMVRALDDPAALAGLVEDRRVNAVLLGPGLGTDEPARALAAAAIALPVALVLDADLFTLFRANPDALRRDHPTVLTPHSGEFERMFGRLPGSKLVQARAAAERTRAVVALKGADTVIAAPDGRAVLNHVHAPGLATAGSGDVLAGAVAGRIAAGDDPFAAAASGVWLHGEAGRTAPPGLIADDLADLIAAVRP